MAEKRVSVRLAAVGGKQVRAELEGVGDAGVKGFGRMSREAEIANAKLAAFASRVKIVAAVAVAAAAAAGIAMIRSGLETIDAQANLAQSLGTTVAIMQVLERAGDLAGVSMGEVEQATVQLTRRLSQASAGTGPAVKALAQLHLTAQGLQKLPLDERIAAIQDALAKYVPEAQRAAVASQLFGDRASLTFGRIDSATLRQATADVRDFGVATSEADAAQIQITNDAISRLGLVWRGLANQLTAAVAPALEAVANAMASATRVGGTFQKSIAFLGRNLGEMASIAGAFAAFFAGRFVWAMGAAALGLRGVTFGLVALKGALIRTGVGALIVGVGELAYRMNLFGDAAVESSAAQTRMNEALGLYAQVGGPDARAEAIASAKAYLDEAAAKLADADATLAQMRAKQTAGNALLDQNPLTRGDTSQGSMGEAMAANVKLAEDALVKAQGEVDVLRAKIKEIEESDPAAPLHAATDEANGLAGALGGAAGQASVLSQYLAGLPGALAGAKVNIAKLQAGIAVMAQGGSVATASIHEYRAGLIAALGPLDKLHDSQSSFLLRGVEQQVRLFEQEQKLQAVRDAQVAALAKVETASRGVAAAGSAAGDAQTNAAELAKAAWQKTADAIKAAQEKSIEMAREVAQDITGPIKDALKSGEFSWRSFATAVSQIAMNLASRLIDLAFKPIEDALIKAFMGGGSGGGSSWVASLFGFARGGVFSGGQHITAFARGGVVDRPTLFPFARGAGLMGEAGPEAILPLSRGRGGRLGVAMTALAPVAPVAPVAPAPSPAPEMSTRIINVLDPAIVGDYLATPAGERAIVNVIRRNRSVLGA